MRALRCRASLPLPGEGSPSPKKKAYYGFRVQGLGLDRGFVWVFQWFGRARELGLQDLRMKGFWGSRGQQPSSLLWGFFRVLGLMASRFGVEGLGFRA